MCTTFQSNAYSVKNVFSFSPTFAGSFSELAGDLVFNSISPKGVCYALLLWVTIDTETCLWCREKGATNEGRRRPPSGPLMDASAPALAPHFPSRSLCIPGHGVASHQLES